MTQRKSQQRQALQAEAEPREEPCIFLGRGPHGNLTQGHWRYGEDGLGGKEDLQQLENEILQQQRVIVEKIEIKGRTNMMVNVRDRWASEEGAMLARAVVSESDDDVRAQDV